LFMNGPNLNLLGMRNPELYGTATLPQVEARCREIARQAGRDLVAYQSNHEGALIDFLQQHRDAAGAIINPGGLAHTSVVLRDAVADCPFPVVEFQHIKLGRGSAQMRMKLRNVRKGDLIERTFQAGDRFQRARLDHRNVQYMYKDGTHFHFMDTASYDQIALDEDQLGDAVN